MRIHELVVRHDVVVNDPQQRIAQPGDEILSGISPRADVQRLLILWPNVCVEALVSLGATVRLLRGATIKEGSQIGDGVTVGAEAVIHERAVVLRGSRIGATAKLGACCILGADFDVPAGARIAPSAVLVRSDELRHYGPVSGEGEMATVHSGPTQPIFLIGDREPLTMGQLVAANKRADEDHFISDEDMRMLGSMGNDTQNARINEASNRLIKTVMAMHTEATGSEQ